MADIGAGSGYMTIRMAQRVGPTGRVYANDLQPQMLDILGRRLAEQTDLERDAGPGRGRRSAAAAGLGRSRVAGGRLSRVLAAAGDAQRLREALKPGGRLVLLEYRKEDPSIPIRPEHKMSVAEAKLEVEARGLHAVVGRRSAAAPAHHSRSFTGSCYSLSPRSSSSFFRSCSALYFVTFSREHSSYGNWLLLVASVVFYANGGGAFTWLMLGSIAFNYWMAIADRSRADAGAPG